MIGNVAGSNSANNDPFLIVEDEKIFVELLPSGQSKSKFDELVAMIVYAQYSRQKHQFVKKYTQDEGKPPTAEILRSIVMSIRNDAALDSIKSQSEKLLKEYTKEYLENAKREEIIEPIEEIIKQNTNFWSSVGANLVAGFIASFILTALLFTATAILPDSKFSKIVKLLMDAPPENVDTLDKNKKVTREN
jgi:hypothetical protein